jgi:serine/threonine-protein kinase SRPK3
MYKHIERTSPSHPGRDALRALLDSFSISRPDGEHQCLVHPPLWDSVRTFLARNPAGRLPKPVLGIVLQRLFLALDFMHNECHLIHTGNIRSSISVGLDANTTHQISRLTILCLELKMTRFSKSSKTWR